MIDRKQFTLDRLLDAMLDTCAGNIDKWREQCAIEPDTHDAGSGRAGRFVVACDGYCLRCLGAGYIWDIYYGEDSQFYNAEHALLALLKAPVPPLLLDRSCWGAPRQCSTFTYCDKPSGRCTLDAGHLGDCRTLASLLADSAALRAAIEGE